MIFAGIDVDIIMHEKALAAGVEAFGLWCWGMCYAQKYKTNGRLPRLVVLAALMGKRNIMLAKRLVGAGLWSENEDGSWTIWNYAKKNQTAEEIEAKQSAAAERVKAWRDRKKQAPREVGNADVTRYTPDPVTRNERVRTDPQTQTPPPLQTPPDNKGDLSTPPEWFNQTAERVIGDTGEKFQIPEAWIRYAGHRRNKGVATNANDAAYWLGTVMVPEARKERQRTSLTREMAKERDEARAPKPEREWRPPADDAEAATPEEHARFAAELQRRLASGAR